jgi:hypothetical protein
VHVTFMRYEVIASADTRRVKLYFQTPDPEPQGPDGNLLSEFHIELTDAQIGTLAALAGWTFNSSGAAPTPAQVTAFWSLANNELARVYRDNNIANRLKAMIGQTEVV